MRGAVEHGIAGDNFLDVWHCAGGSSTALQQYGFARFDRVLSWAATPGKLG
jgi:hypothetical protein